MKDMSDENKYILEYLPVVKQKTYTLGAVYKHFAGHNMYSLIASSSYMNNKNLKYKDNIEEPERLSLDYNSGESEFKLRSENLFRPPYIQLAVGGNVEYIKYTNESYQKIFYRPAIYSGIQYFAGADEVGVICNRNVRKLQRTIYGFARIANRRKQLQYENE